MKVQCSKCGVKLNLPGEKLTPGADFTFNCPKCGDKNTVKVPEESPGSNSLSATSTNLLATAPLDFDIDDPTMSEFFEEGAKPALICFNEGPVRDNLVKVAEQMNFVPVVTEKYREALKHLRLTQYRMVLLNGTFDGMNQPDNVILRHLQGMEMPTRRRIFLALFGQDFQTFDQMKAFALSVNLVVNLEDEPQFKKILHRGFSEYERFYKVFFDVMREMGKI